LPDRYTIGLSDIVSFTLEIIDRILGEQLLLAV
jgi:hypothetical protein